MTIRSTVTALLCSILLLPCHGAEDETNNHNPLKRPGSPSQDDRLEKRQRIDTTEPAENVEFQKWFNDTKDSAYDGNADAQNTIGAAYGNGYGVQQNFSKALKWYDLAANQGHAGAISNINVVFGTIGLPEAYFKLGAIYQKKGGDWIPTAMEYYQKAIQEGHLKAEEMIKTVNHCNIRMIPYDVMNKIFDQVYRGESEFREWGSVCQHFSNILNSKITNFVLQKINNDEIYYINKLPNLECITIGIWDSYDKLKQYKRLNEIKSKKIKLIFELQTMGNDPNKFSYLRKMIKINNVFESVLVREDTEYDQLGVVHVYGELGRGLEKNNCITSLTLENPLCSHKIASKNIAKCLKENKTLRSISVQCHNRLNVIDAAIAFHKHLKNNTTLEKLSIYYKDHTGINNSNNFNDTELPVKKRHKFDEALAYFESRKENLSVDMSCIPGDIW